MPSKAPNLAEATLIRLQHLGMNAVALNQFINLSPNDQKHIADLLDYCEERARSTLAIEMDMQEAGPAFDHRQLEVPGTNPQPFD